MALRGDELPQVRTRVPGPASEALVDVLARRECPAITARRARRATQLGQAADDPIVWEEAAGSVVRDADGNTFIDLTSGFGVAFVGHRHPEVVEAARQQQDRLLHAMGDAYPDVARIHLLDRLAGLCPPGLEAMILGLSGADAVDAAVKTAVVATGRPGVISFEASYHGLSLGTVPLQGYMRAFAEPFREILHPHVRFLPWGCDRATLDEALADGSVGMVLAEPIQGRGGMREPPPGWLQMVAQRTRAAGALLALDEIQTGLGRTGKLLAEEHDGIEADLTLIGKALSGGFYPVSAVLSNTEVMEVLQPGEHGSTFGGNPLACAVARAALKVLVEEGLVENAAAMGAFFLEGLRQIDNPLVKEVRGKGLMIGVEFRPEAGGARQYCLKLKEKGILCKETHDHTIRFAPPLVITRREVEWALDRIAEVLG